MGRRVYLCVWVYGEEVCGAGRCLARGRPRNASKSRLNCEQSQPSRRGLYVLQKSRYLLHQLSSIGDERVLPGFYNIPICALQTCIAARLKLSINSVKACQRCVRVLRAGDVGRSAVHLEGMYNLDTVSLLMSKRGLAMAMVIQRLYCDWIEMPTALGRGDAGRIENLSRATDGYSTLSPYALSQSSMLCLLYAVTSIIAG